MKRTVLSFMLAIISLVTINARIFVLATGVSNYGNEDVNLSQTTKDAKRFKDVMETQTKDITILTSSNVTRANVLEKLRAICNRAQKGDQVVFFYSGHGMPGGICGYDNTISYDDIVEVLSSSKASAKICYIDACHAGSMSGAVKSSDGWESRVKSYNIWASRAKAYKDQAFFVSCRSDEYSSEHPFLGAGLFTQALIKGLKGKSDKNGDKKITVMELFKYIRGDVMKHSKEKQHPQLIAPESMYNVVVSKW